MLANTNRVIRFFTISSRTHETILAFIRAHRAKNSVAVSALRRSLDVGEAEAIVLAQANETTG